MIAAITNTFDAPAIPLDLAAAAFAPAPLGGGVTPGGLPYPTTDDYLSQTYRYIGDLADAAAGRLASPGLVLATGQVVTDANGQAWMTFAGLTRLDGLIPQVFINDAALYFIVPTVMQRSGNAGLVRFRSSQINTNSALMSPYIGVLTVCAYAWGA